MKKTILTITAILIGLFTYSQMNISQTKEKTIGRIAPLGSMTIQCIQYVSESDDTSYTVYFKNMKYQVLNDFQAFSFIETGNDFETFTNLIITKMKNKEKTDVEIKLPDGQLTIRFKTFLGASTVVFYWYEKGVLSYSGELTLTQIKKLFGNNPAWD